MPSNAQSWVFGANDPELGRGLNHLPYTCFLDEKGKRRIAVGIGACLLDLKAASPLIPQHLREALSETTLNHFMGLGPAAWRELRTVLQFLLSRAHRDRNPARSAARTPGRGRGLHRLLCLTPSCAEGRRTLPAREAAARKLRLGAHRIPRSREFTRAQRYRCSSPRRPAPRRLLARLRPHGETGLRA
jgi:hypothetical protein